VKVLWHYELQIDKKDVTLHLEKKENIKIRNGI